VHRVLRETIALAVRGSGVGLLVRNTWARNRVAIVFYHDPDPRTLDEQLAYLAKRYTFITLDALAHALLTPDWASLPPKSVVVTLDDGVRGNFALLDVFRKYGVVPTVYLCTEIVGTTRHYWFYEPGIEVEALKRWPNDERLRYLEAHSGFSPTREYGPEARQALSREELAAMSPHVRFESHTCTHPILTTCTDGDCEREIAQSRSDVTALTGRECRHFSYPNGDYGAREIEVTKRAGYATARTVEIGWTGPATDPFRLPLLTGACDDVSVNFLAAQMAGILCVQELLKRTRASAGPRITATMTRTTLRTIGR
jgi:peptidoglycan/xylan/chitin deacetylase (PgdA/CDA1 family)